MKRLTLKSILLLCAAVAMLVPQANAAIKYWDIDGATPGAGGVGGTAPGGAWTGAFWSTDPDGAIATGSFVSGDGAVFSAGTNATGAFTVSASATASSILVEEGTVSLTGVITLGAGTVTINSNAILNINSSLRISATPGSIMTLNGGTARTSNTGDAGSFVDQDQVIVLNGGGTIAYSVPNVLNIIQSGTVISGTGPLTKAGVGIIAIASASTYTGATLINDGELRIRTSANRLPIGTDAIVSSPGILNLNAVSQQIGSLAGNGSVGLAGATLTIGGAVNTTFDGIITTTANAGGGNFPGSSATGGNVTKQGVGVITLTGLNNFTGLLTLTLGGINVSSGGALCNLVCDVAINGGTLSLSNSAQTIENLFGTGGSIILNSGHTLTINPINAARSATFSGVITGPGAITKIGAPTEFLLGTNTYGGPTTINAGKLYIASPNAATGTYFVAGGSALGTLATTVGTSANVVDLNLADTGALEFDFAGLGFPTAKLLNAGTITVNGTSPVNIRGFDNLTGSFTLLEYTGARSGAGNFVLGTLPPHTSGTFTDDIANSKVILNVTNADTLIWVSDANGVWDVNNAVNQIWKLTPANMAAEYQENAMQGDTVRFDDTATGTTTVSVPVTVSPFKLAVANTTQPYTFTGPGKISGPVTLIKSGGAALTLATTNDYTGGTTLNAGTINIGNNSAFGLGKITINGNVALRSDGATARSVSVPMDLNAGVTLGDPVNNGDLTFSGVIAGTGGITKAGSGTLDFGTQANTYNGGFNHNIGTVRVNSTTSLGAANSAVNLADSTTLSTTAGTARTLTYAFNINGNINLGQTVGGTAAVTLAGLVNLGGADRTITIVNATDTISGVITNGGITKMGAGILAITGASNIYSGTTTINEGSININGTSVLGNGTGALNFAGGKLTTTASRAVTTAPVVNPINITTDAEITTSSTAATVDLNFTGVPSGSAGTLTFRNDAATGTGTFEPRFSAGGFTFNRPINLINNTNGTSSVRLNFFNTNGSGDQTFSAVISGNGGIRRSASTAGTGGRTILTEANAYSGLTTINDGTLVVNNTTGSGTGSGDVAIAARGILAGNGTVSGAVSGAGSIAPGGSVGILTLQNGLNLTGTNIWELGTNTTSGAGTSFDQLVLTGGNLALGAASRLRVEFGGASTFPNASNPFWQATNTWKVISLSGSASNPGASNFSGVDGATGNNAGAFTTSVDVDGSVLLTFTPMAPQPIIEPNIAGAGTTNAVISWSSVNGTNYEVQYKNDLNDADWSVLGSVMATGATASITDTTEPVPQKRFYRIVVK